MINELNHYPDENKIRELIKQGANINAIDRTGENLLMNAISNIEP